MTEPSREENRLAQISEIFQALGQFLVEFSRMVGAMESGLFHAVGGNQQALRAVTLALTGQPLADAWRSVMRQNPDLTQNDQDVLSRLHAEASRLITLRNDWMHGTWFVGYGNEATTDWSEASLLRLKNTAAGVALPEKLNNKPTADYIKSVAEHVSVVADAIGQYGAIVAIRRFQPGITRPSDRVSVIQVPPKKGPWRIGTTNDGVNWRYSVMP